MTKGVDYLHNHSGLERELRFPKHVVLVDLEFKEKFDERNTKEFSVKRDGIVLTFLQVPIMDFVKQGGVFKNFMS